MKQYQHDTETNWKRNKGWEKLIKDIVVSLSSDRSEKNFKAIWPVKYRT